jgi:hypothetical protein
LSCQVSVPCCCVCLKIKKMNVFLPPMPRNVMIAGLRDHP